MKDSKKTKKQLINVLGELRRRMRRYETFRIAPGCRKPAFADAGVNTETILDSLMEHVVYHGLDMEVVWANRAACKSAGMTLAELTGRPCHEIWAKRAEPCVDCPVRLSRETGVAQAVEKKTPDDRFWRIQASPVYDSSGNIIGIVELTLDITERKSAEAALRKSEDRYRTLVETIPNGIQEMDPAELLKSNAQLKREIEKRKRTEAALRQNEKRFKKIVESAPFGYYRLGKEGRYQYVNPEWESMHGWSGGEIIGKSIAATETEESKPRVLEYVQRALDGQTIKGESKRILRSGASAHHELTIQPVYQNGEIVAVEGFINDLTEQKRSEDQVRNLSHLLMQAQERERQMISYELHDRIAQNLSMLKIDCAMLFDDHPMISHELEAKIGEMSKLIELVIASVRDLAYNLRPPGLDEMSIHKAVEIYCEEFSESSGLDVDFQSTGMHDLNFDYDTKLHLYRLVQEGLNNIRKHAEADRATIKIIGASPNIILRIEDNGKGFDPVERERSLDNRKRLGLRSMQERVHLLGGQMTIQSRPLAGTKLFIKFPFKEKERGSA